MISVLLVGEDLPLLSTRSAVLRRAGADVESGRTTEAACLLGKRHFDLMVLCHTIAERDAETLTHLVQQHWPEVRILQVVRDVWQQGPTKWGISAVSSTEPKKLLERTEEVLREQTAYKM